MTTNKTTLKTWLLIKPIQFVLRMLFLLLIAWLPLLIPATIRKIPLHDVVLIVGWIISMVCVFIWAIYKLIKSLQSLNIPKDNSKKEINKYSTIIFITFIIFTLSEIFIKSTSLLTNPVFASIYRIVDFIIAMYLLGAVISELYLQYKHKKMKRKGKK